MTSRRLRRPGASRRQRPRGGTGERKLFGERRIAEAGDSGWPTTAIRTQVTRAAGYIWTATRGKATPGNRFVMLIVQLITGTSFTKRLRGNTNPGIVRAHAVSPRDRWSSKIPTST